jgi:hypothetical protein
MMNVQRSDEMRSADRVCYHAVSAHRGKRSKSMVKVSQTLERADTTLANKNNQSGSWPPQDMGPGCSSNCSRLRGDSFNLRGSRVQSSASIGLGPCEILHYSQVSVLADTHSTIGYFTYGLQVRRNSMQTRRGEVAPRSRPHDRRCSKIVTSPTLSTLLFRLKLGGASICVENSYYYFSYLHLLSH